MLTLLGVSATAAAAIGALSSSASSRDDAATAALLEAAAEGRVGMLTELVEEGLRVDAPGASGETALLVAAASGQELAVEALLGMGADPSAATTSEFDELGRGSSAAHVAASRGRSKALRLLLRADAASSARDAAGRTPVHVACAAAQLECMELLLSAWHAHLLANSLPLAELVQRLGVVDSQGASPLALAAEHPDGVRGRRPDPV